MSRINWECTECGALCAAKHTFCHGCGIKLPPNDKRTGEAFPLKPPYNNLHGLWEVTTEGDCEGRSVKRLGLHFGWVDDIARALAPQTYYSLKFSKKDPTSEKHRQHSKETTTANIKLDIDSDSWDLTPDHRARSIQAVFERQGRNVTVTEGRYYASVLLHFPEN